jgi:hypothetical protein
MAAIAKTKENLNSREIQLGVYVMSELVKLSEKNSQTAVLKKLQDRMKIIESKFMGSEQ